MIEVCFGELNACVKVIHAYTMMRLCNTIKKTEDTGMKRRESLVNPLLLWRFILEVEGENVAISTQTISLKPITGILEIDPKFISILTLESYGLLVYIKIMTNLPGFLNYLG